MISFLFITIILKRARYEIIFMNIPTRLVLTPHDDDVLGQLSSPEHDLLLYMCGSVKGEILEPQKELVQRFKKSCRYVFNEYDVDSAKKEGILERYSSIGPLFTPHHARQIFDDVEEFLPSCSGLVISCNGGLNRTPRIAAALNDTYQWGFQGSLLQKVV